MFLFAENQTIEAWEPCKKQRFSWRTLLQGVVFGLLATSLIIYLRK